MQANETWKLHDARQFRGEPGFSLARLRKQACHAIASAYRYGSRTRHSTYSGSCLRA
jgi:hypothetical protein